MDRKRPPHGNGYPHKHPATNTTIPLENMASLCLWFAIAMLTFPSLHNPIAAFTPHTSPTLALVTTPLSVYHMKSNYDVLCLRTLYENAERLLSFINDTQRLANSILFTPHHKTHLRGESLSQQHSLRFSTNCHWQNSSSNIHLRLPTNAQMPASIYLDMIDGDENEPPRHLSATLRHDTIVHLQKYPAPGLLLQHADTAEEIRISNLASWNRDDTDWWIGIGMHSVVIDAREDATIELYARLSCRNETAVFSREVVLGKSIRIADVRRALAESAVGLTPETARLFFTALFHVSVFPVGEVL